MFELFASKISSYDSRSLNLNSLKNKSTFTKTTQYNKHIVWTSLDFKRIYLLSWPRQNINRNYNNQIPFYNKIRDEFHVIPVSNARAARSFLSLGAWHWYCKFQIQKNKNLVIYHKDSCNRIIKQENLPTNANDKQELRLWVNIKPTFQLCLTLQPNQLLLLNSANR